MEEPVRMMLLDAIFTDAPVSSPATPPSVLLYGLNSEGVSIAVHVNDFVPYFWFPAPVCNIDGIVVPLNEGLLDTVKEHLNRKVLASRKKTGVSSESGSGTTVDQCFYFYFRKPLENGQGALCQDCTLAGRAQGAAIAIFYDMAEQRASWLELMRNVTGVNPEGIFSLFFVQTLIALSSACAMNVLKAFQFWNLLYSSLIISSSFRRVELNTRVFSLALVPELSLL